MFFTKKQTTFTCLAVGILLTTYLHGITPEPVSLDQEYVLLARTVKEAGDTEKAVGYYTKALQINPKNFLGYFELANIFYAQDKFTEALTYYNHAAQLSPEQASIHFNVGMCHQKLSALAKNPIEKIAAEDRALECYERTIMLNPQHIKAYKQLAPILKQRKNLDKAAELYTRSLQIEPTNADTFLQLGHIYRDQEKFDQSVDMYRKAVEFDPHNIQVIFELANTLNMIDENDQALVLYKRILEMNPNALEALYNFGFTLKKQGNFKEAMEIYTKLIELRPTYAHPHFSLALCLLALGNFEDGWKKYEWRWQAYNETPRKYTQPMWDGSDIKGKTILLYSEQGLGDTFQFIRYAQLLKQQGATVIFDTQRPLKTILSLCPYIDKLITSNEPVPPFDYQLPIMSAPLIFKTTVTTVPVSIPYLYADNNLVEVWREKLSSDKNFKIGICWQGNAHYSTQFLRKTVAAKSMHVTEFEPLMQLPSISIYSLQKINGADQLTSLSPASTLYHFDTDFDDSHGRFMDTAALIKNLDLVVTVDTSISHFAAALGIPTWIMLPNPPDWRWMLDRTDTPWYPNVRLFRQPIPGDWKSVIHTIVQELTAITSRTKESHFCELTFLHHQLAQVNKKITKLTPQITRSANTLTPDNHDDSIEQLYQAYTVKKYLAQQISKLEQRSQPVTAQG